MIGTKTVASGALLLLCALGAWLVLQPGRLISTDPTTLFWIGLFSTIAGPLIVRYWRVDRRSHYYFRYAYNEREWEDESSFLSVGPHRISIGDNTGEAVDFWPVVHHGIYITTLFLIGLVAIDNRALDLIVQFPSRIAAASSQTCPEASEEDDSEQTQDPGCVLVRRAFELGYAKDLGPCGKKEEEETEQQVCTLRLQDEPLLHYAWRRLEQAFVGARDAATTDQMLAIKETFVRKLDHVETLYGAQKSVIGTAPRASHHLFTNLKNPDGWRGEVRTRVGDPGECVDRYRRLAHRSHHAEQPDVMASAMLDHIFGKLLFEPRYAPPAGYCREYTIHWDSPEDACERLAHDAEAFLAEQGALQLVQQVLSRIALREQLKEVPATVLADRAAPPPAGAKPRANAPPVDRFVSFQCYIEQDRLLVARTPEHIVVGGHQFTAPDLRVPETTAATEPATAYVERMSHVASLLAQGFHYGGLMSEAPMGFDPESIPDTQILAGKSFLLAELDILADIDVFLGHYGWVLSRDDLPDVYPYHLHLRNFVEVFRRQYRVARGRL